MRRHFFGDGASACVVGTRGANRKGWFALGSHRTVILPDSTDDMVWRIGNHGFQLYLSPRIPALIGESVPAEVRTLLDGESLPDLWAIHPGGRGIIDALQTIFGLSDDQTRASRSVLREYGNLSSATILFVLQEMRAELERQTSVPRQGWRWLSDRACMRSFCAFSIFRLCGCSKTHQVRFMFNWLGQRAEAKELMDDFSIGGADLREALRHLRRLNRIFCGGWSDCLWRRKNCGPRRGSLRSYPSLTLAAARGMSTGVYCSGRKRITWT